MWVKTIKILAFIIFLIVLFLGSEFVYILRNKPEEVGMPFYVFMAKISLLRSDVQGSVNYLDLADEFILRDEALGYPEKNLPTKLTTYELPVNPSLRNELIKFLRTVNFSDLSRRRSNQWVLMYYSMGLISYRNKAPESAVRFWKSAVYTAPELSFTYVELANYYLNANQAAIAEGVLKDCLGFVGPQVHCNLFLKQNVQTHTPEAVGFMDQIINNYLK